MKAPVSDSETESEHEEAAVQDWEQREAANGVKPEAAQARRRLRGMDCTCEAPAGKSKKEVKKAGKPEDEDAETPFLTQRKGFYIVILWDSQPT